MSVWRVGWKRCAGLFGRERRDAELAEELEAHLALHTEDGVRAGMSREDARRAALLKLGGMERTKQEYRERRGVPMLEKLWQDARFAVRTLRKSPGFTLVAVLTVALAIGANTAIFTVVYGVLFRPLGFPEPDRILQLAEETRGNVEEMSVTSAQLRRLREFGQPFEGIAGWTEVGYNLATDDAAEHLRGMPVSKEFLEVMGVSPQIGRAFTAEEDAGDGQKVAIISNGLWKRRFGGDPGAVGRAIHLNGEAFTLVGVMPAGFDIEAFGFNPGPSFEVWTPLALVEKTVGSGENIGVFARVRRGVTLAQVKAQMDVATLEFRKEYPEDVGRETSLRFPPYRQMIGSETRPYLLLLLGAIGFVLLIACANVASLFLARAGTRGREMAVRTALGATRGRLAQQLLVESLLVALAGGALGVGIAAAGMRMLVRMAPLELPRLDAIHLDGPALLFTLGLTLLTGLAFGCLPALNGSRTELAPALNESAGRASGGEGRARLRRGLVVGEFAMSLVLLTGAILMMTTFAKLLAVDPGFDPHRVLTMQFWLDGSRYNTTPAIANFHRTLEQKLAAVPGIEAAGIVAAGLPLERGGNNGVRIAGAEEAKFLQSNYREASPGYFRAMGMRVRHGRGIEETDAAEAQAVVVVNEAFVRRYLADREPLGQRVIVNRVPCEVVGVVADVRSYLDQPVQPTVFIPSAQAPYGESRLFEGWFPRNIAVRTQGDPGAMRDALREAVRAVDPLVPMGTITTMDERILRSIALRRFLMLLLGTFGGLAIVLASVGMFGVISYTVAQRTREIGIRMALGATPGSVLSLVLHECGAMLALGTCIGLAGVFAAHRLLEGMLFGVGSLDPASIAGAGALLGAVALAACVVPARRAMRVDPAIALRYE